MHVTFSIFPVWFIFGHFQIMSGFAGIRGWRIRINADYREEKIHTSKESKYQFHNGNKSAESETAKANQKHLLSIPHTISLTITTICSQGFWPFAFLSSNIFNSTISSFDTKNGKQSKELV